MFKRSLRHPLSAWILIIVLVFVAVWASCEPPKPVVDDVTPPATKVVVPDVTETPTVMIVPTRPTNSPVPVTILPTLVPTVVVLPTFIFVLPTHVLPGEPSAAPAQIPQQ